MKRRLGENRPIGFVICLLALAGCGSETRSVPKSVGTGEVDLQRLNADRDAGQWLANGRDIGKTFYSPLQDIDRDNVSRLGFAWEFQTGTARGMESTPQVIDGVMYVSGVAGRMYALDAATGKPLWRFEPQIDLKYSRSGLSVWQGRVYVATVDGILYALDAHDGHVLWKADTVTDRTRAYSVTGAPQVAGRVIVIGNGGAEYDSRGYVSAYDLATGALAWRFFTVPGDPSKPQESAALEKAVKTWSGNWWERGAGGNVWDAITYDPETDLVYFGTANGAPTSLSKRSPGGGDNLYIASIVAVHAATGEYAWHYQQTPGERWDYDATPHIMLATLTVQGQPRKVLMQASKNGFFYVIDRRTGELLKADPFVATTWAKSIDLKTGRPVEEAAAEYGKSPRLIFPSTIGAHNFNPMSLSARTGLVYIPTVHAGMVLAESPPLAPRLPGRFETGLQMALSAQLAAPQSLPPSMQAAAKPAALKGQPDIAMSAALKAWDPVNGKVIWEAKGVSFADHGGVMSTGGGLVVQGGLDGALRVFDDQTGALLKQIDVGTAMIAAPMTYRVGNVQYIAITAGSGGGGWFTWSRENAAYTRGNANRVLAFRLDGGPTPVPPELPPIMPIPKPPESIGTAKDIQAGAALFSTNCGHCHANVPRAPVPDLRRSALIADEGAFRSVVRGGVLQERGMPKWDDLLTDEQVHLIRAWLIELARQGYQAERSSGDTTAPVRDGLVSGHP